MGDPVVCMLQGKWRSTDSWKPTCRIKTRIQQLKWLERITEKNVLCTYLFKSRRTAPGADYRLLTAPLKGWDFDFMSFHTPKNSQPNGWLEVGKTSTQVCIISGSSFIDLRRLLSMFWHLKIDNEQSRVLGGGGVMRLTKQETETVRPCESVSAKKICPKEIVKRKSHFLV